ncbi:hypothetical protein J1N35_043100 [Gossypium stocksii]|uniref:Uncharacterized protein n=1 Tax=Gossypium stocksii TaxID=47602 RepID=A0A9D3U6Q6_9ROSI|nr:hypothetical protein J1N35_043100 [Gossypium stocksii]
MVVSCAQPHIINHMVVSHTRPSTQLATRLCGVDSDHFRLSLKLSFFHVWEHTCFGLDATVIPSTPKPKDNIPMTYYHSTYALINLKIEWHNQTYHPQKYLHTRFTSLKQCSLIQHIFNENRILNDQNL